MTTVEISLPDELAQRARREGLLSDTAIQQLLEEAIRRQAGRALLWAALDMRAAAVPVMSMDEVDVAVKAARAERRANTATPPVAGPDDDAGRP